MRIGHLHISVVTPVFGCKTCLKELNDRLKKTLECITSDFEVIMVNDASPDGAWPIIRSMARDDPRVKGLMFSRNFGQHVAIAAGLDYASGDWVIVMDCDLQDQPEQIPHLYEKAQEGYDIVFARRAKRKDGWIKRVKSRLFYKIYDYFTEGHFDPSIANFSIVSRQVVDELVQLREKSRSYPLFLKWLGFEWTTVNVEHAERANGKSSYSLSKLIYFATESIVSQSNKPLRLSIKFGFLISFLSLVYGFFLIYKYFFLYQPIAGWTSVMVSICFISGLLFANLGVLGLYIGKIFDEAKDRPLYVVKGSIGFQPSKKRLDDHRLEAIAQNAFLQRGQGTERV